MALLAFQKAANATPAEAVSPADVKPTQAKIAGVTKGKAEETPAKEQNGRQPKKGEEADKLALKRKTLGHEQQPGAKPETVSKRRGTVRSKDEAPKEAPSTSKTRGKSDSAASDPEPRSSEPSVREEEKTSQDKAPKEGTDKAGLKRPRTTFGQVTSRTFWQIQSTPQS